MPNWELKTYGSRKDKTNCIYFRYRQYWCTVIHSKPSGNNFSISMTYEKKDFTEIQKPNKLPFLEAVCWDLCDTSVLDQDEILDRYERGWGYRGILADINPEEQLFILNLARAKGSWLQTCV